MAYANPLIFMTTYTPSEVAARLSAQVTIPRPFHVDLLHNWHGRVTSDGFDMRLNLRGARGIGPELRGWFTPIEGGTLVQITLNLSGIGDFYSVFLICCTSLLLSWLILGFQPLPLKLLETLLTLTVLPWFMWRWTKREHEAALQQILTLLTNDMGLDAQVLCLSTQQQEWLTDWRENARWAAANPPVR